MPVVNTYYESAAEPYQEPEYDEDLLSNSLLKGDFDFDSLNDTDLFSGGILADAVNDPDSLVHHSNFRAGSGMDNAVDVGYMNHTYIGDDGLRYKMVVSWDEDKQAMKYEQYDERVYRWSPSDEHKRTHRDQSVIDNAYGQEFNGGTGSGWYTEAEIKKAWDAGDMGQMQEQGVSWDQYWGYVTGVDQLINDGALPDYSDMDPREIAALQESGEYVNWSDVPEYMALVNDLGIPTQFESEGDVYNFNGFGYSRDYWADKTDAPVELINAVALGAIGSFVAGPLLAGAFQAAGMSAAAAAAASKGVISLATQYMTTGDLSIEDALLSAALSYGGSELQSALEGSGVIGDIGSAVTDFGDELATNGGDILSAALQAGGMSMVTQLVKDGEIDWKDAAMAAAMAGGTAALQGFLSDIGKSDEIDNLEEWDEYDEWQQEAINADIKDPFLNPNYKTVGDGLVMNINTGEVFGQGGIDSKSYGQFSDLDKDGDGVLNGNDLSEITTPDRDLKNIYGYEMGDTVYVDANGNPVDPKLVKFRPDGSYVGYDANGNRVTVTGTTYDQAFGGDKGGLEWKFGLNEDGSVSTTDGAIYYENGELAYEKVNGQWIDANGNIVDDPAQVDDLTMIAAKAIDEPLNSVEYFDQDGNPVTFGKVPLRDGYESGQYAGTIFGRDGKRYDFDPKTGLYKFNEGSVDNPGATSDEWYDPITNTTYTQDSEGKLIVTKYDEPIEDKTPVDPVDPVDPKNTTDSNQPGGTDGSGDKGDPGTPDTSSNTPSPNPDTNTSSGGVNVGGYTPQQLAEIAQIAGTTITDVINRINNGESVESITASANGDTSITPNGANTDNNTNTNQNPNQTPDNGGDDNNTGNPDPNPTPPPDPVNPTPTPNPVNEAYEARIQELMARGMSREQAEGNQASAIAQGADANEDGAVTNEEWSLFKGLDSNAGNGGSNSDGSGGNTEGGTGGGTTGGDQGGDGENGGDGTTDTGGGSSDGDGEGNNSGDGTGNGFGLGNGGGGMLSGSGDRDRPVWGPLLQGYQFQAKPKSQPTIGQRLFADLFEGRQ